MVFKRRAMEQESERIKRSSFGRCRRASFQVFSLSLLSLLRLLFPLSPPPLKPTTPLSRPLTMQSPAQSTVYPSSRGVRFTHPLAAPPWIFHSFESFAMFPRSCCSASRLSVSGNERRTARASSRVRERSLGSAEEGSAIKKDSAPLTAAGSGVSSSTDPRQ